MEFNASHGYVAGIDIGPTRTRLAIADLRGKRLAHRVVATPNAGPEDALSRVAAEVLALLTESHIPVARLLAAAAGVPGVVDRDRGVVVALAPNLKGWSQVPIAKIVRRHLGAP